MSEIIMVSLPQYMAPLGDTDLLRGLAAAMTTIEAIPSLNSVCRNRVGKSVGSMESTRMGVCGVKHK